MKTSSGCPQCAVRHALYVKAHRQLQAARLKIIQLEGRIRELEPKPTEPRIATETTDAG